MTKIVLRSCCILDEGFHTLHYQVIDSKGEASPARTAPFFRLPPKDEAFKDYEVKDIQYWFDEDIATIRTGTFMPGAIGLDLSSLSEGAHNMYYQLVADNHQVSPVKVASINRYLYDIYVSQPTEYDDSYIAKDPLFAEKPELKLHYSADDISIRGQLTIKEDATISLGKLVQTGCLGYYNNSNKYTKTGIDYYHPTTLISNGFMRADSVIVKENFYRDRWHFITLPFNTKVGDIDVPEGTYWAIRKYDGAARAAGEMINTWKNLQEADIMEAGQGYILQLTKEGTDKSSCLTFKAINDTHKNDLFATQDVSIALQDHQSEFAHNRSWNLIGNPYPCFYDTRLMNLNGTITVWNGNGYSAYSLADDMYILMPFESFFIQKPVDAETLTFSKEGRQHTAVPSTAQAPKRAGSNSKRNIYNFVLSDGENGDHTRIVVNEQASLDYESDKDAPKFMENMPQVAQIFSTETGVRYAINERPLGDGIAVLSVYAPEDGEYSLSTEGSENILILDTETNTIWSALNGSYDFTARAGMHSARFVVSLNGNATAIDRISAYDDGELELVADQLAFHFTTAKNIKLFSLDGRVLYSETTANGSVKLAHGVYIVNINGKVTKIMVR